MIKFRSKAIGGLALAVASITALAACSSSSSQQRRQHDQREHHAPRRDRVGADWRASGAKLKAGTITYALQPGASPNSIFPIPNSGNNTVNNAFQFQWQLWRPLYWPVNGTVPEIDQSQSIADPPVYSNGDKTVSITMKSNYKWSDGQPITANDLLFAIDLIKAGVKESPANWAIYVPGQFPDTLVSTSEPNASTLVLHRQRPRQPVLVHPRTSSARDRRRCRCPATRGPRSRRAVRSSRRPSGPRPR